MSLDFFIGQEVVCVDDRFDEDIKALHMLPVLNNIYTIRGVDVFFDDQPTCVLEEVKNDEIFSYGYGMKEFQFFLWHFKPLKKTSIETFEKLLTSLPLKSTIPKILEDA